MTASTATALDPQIYHLNLAALSRQQPAVCELIKQTALPDHVEAAEGRDDSPTFRLDLPTGRRQWLGHSSMPSVSSPAMLAHFAYGSGNVLLPSIGHGGEATHLLQKMACHQAVFTWDLDAVVPALALRLQDFSRAIAEGRLVLAIGPRPYEALLQSFQDYPTHLPPTKLFSAPHLRPPDVLVLQTQVEQAVGYQNGRLMRETAQQSAELARLRSDALQGAEHALIMSMVMDPEVTRVAEALQRCAAHTGIVCTAHTVNRPAHVHLLAAVRRLKSVQPTTVILLNQMQNEWGDLLKHVPRCSAWFVSSSAHRPEALDDCATGRLIHVINQDLAEQMQPLQDRGCALHVLGPAADETSFSSTEIGSAEHREYGSDVAIIADAVDFSADAIGLSWESHKALLEETIQLIRADPRRLDLTAADRLIEKAARCTDVKLDSPEIRAEFSRFISAGIAPTLTVCSLLQELRNEQIDVRLWGSNWARHDAVSKVHQRPHPCREQRNLIYNAAKVVVHVRNDQWYAPHLVEGLASGACVLNQVQINPAGPADPAWEELLEAIPSFSRVPDAVVLIRELLADPVNRRARLSTAHRLVRQLHLMGHRLKTLLTQEK